MASSQANEVRTLREAIENLNLKIKVRAIAHKQTSLIQPRNPKHSPYIHTLLVDKNDTLVGTTFIKTTSTDMTMGVAYTVEITTSDKYGSITGRITGASVTEDKPLSKWYKEVYQEWAHTSISKISIIKDDADIKGGKKDQVNIHGRIRMVGEETICDNGSTKHSYALADDTGTITISVFGHQQFAVNQALSFRNVKVTNEMKFTVDELTDVYSDGHIEGTMDSPSASQEFISSQSSSCWNQGSPFRNSIASSSGSPNTERMKLVFRDPDSFYCDLRELYEENQKSCDLKKCLPHLREKNVFRHIDGNDLLQCVIDAIDQTEDMKKVVALLQLIEMKEPMDQNNEDGSQLFTLSIACVLQKFIQYIDKGKLFDLYTEMQIPFDGILTLLRSAMNNMDSSTRRHFKKKMNNFFEAVSDNTEELRQHD